MPVDKEILKATIREAAGDDNELYSLLETKLAANDAAASQFMSGFMRNRDYTSKTQALANDRRALDENKQSLEGQLEQYRQALEGAEADKAKVLRDLAQQKVTVAQAHARLKHIKETYALSDDDIPPFQDLIDTRRSGKPVDSTDDVDTKLAAFKKEMTDYLAQKLVPELGGMAKLHVVWNDIIHEHTDLTGKYLSAKEQDELLAEADKRHRAGRPMSLKQLWEEKYDAPSLRQKKHDEEVIKTERAKWDAEAQAKRSEEAMQGLHPTPGNQQGLRTSQILDHKFQVHEELPGAAPKRAEGKSANQRQSLSGAERAGKRYLERRAAGVPMGAPDERPIKVA